jgi:hypothetical protein
MLEGKINHAVLDLKHEKEAVEVMSLEDALTKSKEQQIAFITRDVFVENDYVIGRIDEIHILPEQILIIDDKPVKDGKVWPSDKNQVWGYCWAYSDQNKPDRPVYGAVRNSTTLQIEWQERFTENEKNEIKKIALRILNILKGTQPASPTNNPSKCKPCRFRKVCDKAAYF